MQCDFRKRQCDLGDVHKSSRHQVIWIPFLSRYGPSWIDSVTAGWDIDTNEIVLPVNLGENTSVESVESVMLDRLFAVRCDLCSRHHGVGGVCGKDGFFVMTSKSGFTNGIEERCMKPSVCCSLCVRHRPSCVSVRFSANHRIRMCKFLHAEKIRRHSMRRITGLLTLEPNSEQLGRMFEAMNHLSEVFSTRSPLA